MGPFRVYGTLKIDSELRKTVTTGGPCLGSDPYRVRQLLSIPERKGYADFVEKERCVVNCAFLRLNVTDERNRIRNIKGPATQNAVCRSELRSLSAAK